MATKHRGPMAVSTSVVRSKGKQLASFVGVPSLRCFKKSVYCSNLAFASAWRDVRVLLGSPAALPALADQVSLANNDSLAEDSALSRSEAFSARRVDPVRPAGRPAVRGLVAELATRGEPKKWQQKVFRWWAFETVDIYDGGHWLASRGSRAYCDLQCRVTLSAVGI